MISLAELCPREVQGARRRAQIVSCTTSLRVADGVLNLSVRRKDCFGTLARIDSLQSLAQAICCGYVRGNSD
ncbi:MAG TPA: hypothetical protein VHC69_25810 [Polyangiaceae bacterium]|nr:hypothetical protein [Polyangiaceae bacterium]